MRDVLQGRIDEARVDKLRGWARDEHSPDQPVRLSIEIDARPLAAIVANEPRGDLAASGFGRGHHGFELVFDPPLDPTRDHVIEVRRIPDGIALSNSPFRLPAAAAAITTLRGNIDALSRTGVRGWAMDGAAPERRVALTVFANGEPIGHVLANRYRGDLEQAGFGSGRHGFDLELPAALSPATQWTIEIRSDEDGAHLPGSPALLPAPIGWEAHEAALAKLFEATASGPDGAALKAFLLRQLDLILQRDADAASGTQARHDHAAFGRRWRLHQDGGPDPLDPPATDALQKQSLVIDLKWPDARRDAGSTAILSHIRALQGLGHRVSLAAAEMQPGGVVPPDVRACAPPLYGSVEEVLRREGKAFDLIYLHRVDTAARYFALARAHAPKARIVYSVADLAHLRVGRQAVAEERPELLLSARHLRMVECYLALQVDGVLTHSTEEAALLRQAVPAARVHVVRWSMPARPVTQPFAARRGVAFIGSYSHAANCDAAFWLAEEVMERVWEQVSDLPCLLAGSDPPATIRALGRPGLEVVGRLEDVGALYERVRLTTAPLRFGAGLKGKVIESFAAGLPCAMTPIAAEGFPLPDILRACVGATAASLAACIVDLHENAARHAEVAEAALTLAREVFSDAATEADMRSALK